MSRWSASSQRSCKSSASRLGERAEAFEADVTDFEALTRAVDGTVARFGGIDVAIANAGVAFTGSLINAPIEQVERTLAVNLLGVWRTDRAVMEQLIARRGYLLNISSLSAIVHPPMIGAYATAKSGVDGLSDSLRAELAPSGVQVGCAYFGFLDTDLVRAGYSQPSAQVANGSSPSFIRNPAPVSKAIDAIERGIERRSARVWAPRWVGPMIALRGLLQPLVERRVLQRTRAHGRGDPPGRPRVGLGRRAGPVAWRRRPGHQALTETALLRLGELPYGDAEHDQSEDRDDRGLDQRGHAPAEPGDAGTSASRAAGETSRCAKIARRIGSTA